MEVPMPDLTIHDVPQTELDALASRGARHGRSAEEEARHMIHEAAAEELLLAELERATRAVEEKQKQVTQPAGPAAGAPRGRYRRVEPTPGRR
jgi:plasmid stability protein